MCLKTGCLSPTAYQYSPSKFSCFLRSSKTFLEVVIDEPQALTPAMIAATKHPWGYGKVSFCYSPTEKSLAKSRRNRNSGDFVAKKSARNRNKWCLHEQFGIAHKIAANIATKVTCANGPLITVLRRLRGKEI